MYLETMKHRAGTNPTLKYDFQTDVLLVEY